MRTVCDGNRFPDRKLIAGLALQGATILGFPNTAPLFEEKRDSILLALTAATVTAQNYPDKPIRLIVPYAPGGSSDILARLLGQRLADSMGQPVVVDNRAGAGSMIGTALTAKAPADGYTLILSDMPHTINPAVYSKVPYDPVDDFTPVTLIARAPTWLFLNPAVPAKTVSEFVALAKNQPGRLAIGSAGNGSGTHLVAELLQRGAGIQLTHVPFKGAGPSIAAVVAGEIQASFTSMPAALPPYGSAYPLEARAT